MTGDLIVALVYLKKLKSFTHNLFNAFTSVSQSTHPSIGIYFSVCLALMVISLLETVVITNVLHHSSMKYQDIPNWVRVVILKHIANLICYQWPEAVQPPSKPHTEKPESSNGSSGPCISQQASQTPAQHPTNSGGNQTDPANTMAVP